MPTLTSTELEAIQSYWAPLDTPVRPLDGYGGRDWAHDIALLLGHQELLQMALTHVERVLAWYADPAHYHPSTDLLEYGDWVVQADEGATARVALDHLAQLLEEGTPR